MAARCTTPFFCKSTTCWSPPMVVVYPGRSRTGVITVVLAKFIRIFNSILHASIGLYLVLVVYVRVIYALCYRQVRECEA